MSPLTISNSSQDKTVVVLTRKSIATNMFVPTFVTRFYKAAYILKNKVSTDWSSSQELQIGVRYLLYSLDILFYL